MGILVVEAPADPLIDIDLLKTHCGIDADDEDDLLDQIIAAVGEVLDNPGGPNGVAIRAQRLEMLLPGFPRDAIEIGARPLRAGGAVAVTYFDPANVQRTLAPEAYFIARTIDGAHLMRTPGTPFPATACRPDAVQIQFDAGHTEIPKRYVQAALLYGGDLYEARETFREGVVSKVPMSIGVENLLGADWRPTIV